MTISIQWSQKMNLYLLIFCFIQYPFLFVTNIACDLNCSSWLKEFSHKSLATKNQLKRPIKNRCFSCITSYHYKNLTNILFKQILCVNCFSKKNMNQHSFKPMIDKIWKVPWSSPKYEFHESHVSHTTQY